MEEKSESVTISDMPDEVLIEIFRLCSSELLKLLALVCERWHEIISHAPELTRRFRLNLSRDRLSDVLELSRKFQNIRINSLDFYTCEILERHSPIRSLELNEFDVDLEILANSLKEMNLLENFSATSVTFFNIQSGAQKISLRNLKTIALNSSNLAIIGMISTSSLNSFSIKNIDDTLHGDEIVEFLTSQASLNTLKITGPIPVELFKPEIFSKFQFKLKYLKINIESGYSEEDLQKFLESQKDTLRTLKLKNPLEDNTVKYILHNLTSLESLEMSIDFLQTQQPEFFEEFEPLPNVKTLKIYGVFHYKLDNAKLFLDLFPSIENLNMKNCSPNLGFNSFLVYVSLKYPKLRNLHCFHLHTHVHGQVVGSLTFDDLKEFHVAQLLNQNFYSTFIRRHADSLEKISIDRVNLANFTPGFFANAIACCTNLREISFTSDTPVIEKMFRKVHIRCPRNSDNFFESWRTELKPKNKYRLSFKFPDDVKIWVATWYDWNDEIDKASGSFEAE